MVKVRNLNFAYGSNVIFDNFAADFPSSKISCILGPSGCGKTTLLNIIAKTLVASGEVEGQGRVSYVFQNDRLIKQKTLMQNLLFALSGVYDREEQKRKAEEYCRKVGLFEDKDLYPSQLSGGMSQRVSLARAFAFPSNTILLDEPFKALDFKTKQSIISVFLQLVEAEKRTVIMVTHDIEETVLLADEIFVFSNRPVKIINRYEIMGERQNRKLYDEDIMKISANIFRDFEKM